MKGLQLDTPYKTKMEKKMDELDVMNKALKEYETARRLKRINQELYDHLVGSIYYLLKYSEKYNVIVPKKDELLRVVEKSNFYIDQIRQQPTGNTENNNQQGNRTGEESK